MNLLLALCMQNCVHKASNYAYELNDSGWSVQYGPKSFIMTDSRCLHRFQGSWQIAQIFGAK